MSRAGETVDTLNAKTPEEALKVLEVIHKKSDTTPRDIVDSFQLSGLSIRESVQVYAAFMHRNAEMDVCEFDMEKHKRNLWKEVCDGL